jgi:hypothetical protein
MGYGLQTISIGARIRIWWGEALGVGEKKEKKKSTKILVARYELMVRNDWEAGSRWAADKSSYEYALDSV